MKQETFEFTKAELVEMLQDALANFGFVTCPFCERDLDLDLYITATQVDDWVDERLLSTEKLLEE